MLSSEPDLRLLTSHTQPPPLHKTFRPNSKFYHQFFTSSKPSAFQNTENCFPKHRKAYFKQFWHAWQAGLVQSHHPSFHPAIPGWNSSLVVFGLAVHSVAGSILLWGHFPAEGIFPLELTWVQTPFPTKLFRMRV